MPISSAGKKLINRFLDIDTSVDLTTLKTEEGETLAVKGTRKENGNAMQSSVKADLHESLSEGRRTWRRSWNISDGEKF